MNIKRAISIFFLLLTSLFANQDEDFTQERTILLQYQQTPKSVFVGEVFSIEIRAIVATPDFDSLQTEFEDTNNSSVLNPDSSWTPLDKHTFLNKFYFKLNNKKATLPKLTLNALQSGYVLDMQSISAPKIKVLDLKDDSFFSHIIAQSLEVKKIKTSMFDDNTKMVMLEIDSKYANIKDFSLKWVIKDGIDSVTGNFPDEKIFYFAHVPSETKEFIFTYFDINKKTYEKIALTLLTDEDRLSTQTELNPKENPLVFYKSVLLITLFVIFFILFLWKLRWYYLLFSIVTLSYYIFFFNTTTEITIHKNTSIRILPTKNSTIFHATEEKVNVEKLGKKGIYVKILLPDGKIGWIDEKDILKN